MVGEEEVIFRTCFLFVSVRRQGRLVAMYELLVSEGGGVVCVWPGFGRVYTMLGLDAISSTGFVIYRAVCPCPMLRHTSSSESCIV